MKAVWRRLADGRTGLGLPAAATNERIMSENAIEMENGGPRPVAPARLAWVDNVRTTVIVLVVHMHACVTYSHLGSWYTKVGAEPSMTVKLPFLFWQGHLQTFFMGVLFFLAGVFAHRSLARRGPRGFLAERAVRLGLPTLLYMLLLQPFIVYVLLGEPHVANRPSLPAWYATYLASGRVLSGNGPLWFTLALLIFSVGLVVWRALRPPRPPDVHRFGRPPTPMDLLAFGLTLVAVTFLVRLSQPLGTSVLNLQLCYFPQYIAAFCAGVAAARLAWFESLSISFRAQAAGWLGVIGGPMLFGLVMSLGSKYTAHDFEALRGGWNGAAFGTAAWEQLAGLGLGLGMLALFRHQCDSGNRLTRWLSDRSFAVYVLHAPVLVSLTAALRPLGFNPFVGTVVLTILGLAASFLVADVARRVPGLRAIL